MESRVSPLLRPYLSLLILIPANTCSSLEEMTEMVQEVNETQVEAEELLADHAYYYSSEQQRLILSDWEF